MGALLAGVGATTLIALERHEAHMQGERHAQEVLLRLAGTRADLLVATARLGEAAPAGGLDGAQPSVAARFNAERGWLHELTGDSAEQRARLGEVEAAIAQASPDLVQRIDSLFGAMHAEQARLVAERRSAARRAGWLASGSALAGTLLGLAGVLATGAYLLRRFERHTERMRAAFGALREGHLSHRVELDGTAERRQFATEFNAMAERLAAAAREREHSRVALRKLFDAAPVAQFLVRPGGGIVVANRRAEQLLGWTADRLGQRSMCEAFPEADRDMHRQALARFFEAPFDRPMGDDANFTARHASGRELPVEVSVSAVEIDGETLALVGVVDISERQRARAALDAARDRTEKALARLQLMTESAGLGTWFWSLSDNAIAVDERYASMLGETPGSFGRQLEDFQRRLHPDDAARCWGRVEQHLRGERDDIDCEFRLRHADGHWVWIASYGRIARRDAEGNAVALAGTHRDITTAKLAEAEREAQRRLFDSMVRNVPGVFHRVRFDRGRQPVRYEFLAEAAARFFGLPDRQPGPADIFRLVDPPDRPGFDQALEHALAQEGSFDQEFGVRRPDGTYRRVRLIATRAETDGDDQLWDGTFIDVTAEWQSRRASAEALQRLETVTRGAKVATWTWRPKTGALWVDDYWFEQLGRRPGEFEPTLASWSALLHPDDRPEAVASMLAAATSSEDEFRYEARHRHRDGTWRWIRWQGRVVERDGAGEPVFIVAIDLDVTAEHAARRTIETQQRRLEAMSKNMPVVVYRWVGRPGLTRRIEYLGGPVGEMLGIDVETFEQHGLRAVLSPAEHDQCMASVAERIIRRLSFEFEAPVGREGQPLRWLRVQSTFAGVQGEDLAYDGAITDTTAPRQAQEALERARAAAEAAARAKSVFLASMSHEIRTPLNGVIGASNLLAATRLDEEQRELVAMQLDAGETLLGVINDILDLSTIEAGRLELDEHPFDLATLVRRTLAMVRPQAAANRVALGCRLATPFEPGVVGDAMRIRQVLLNLVANAVKFSPGGRVTVQVDDVPAPPAQRRVRIAVKDTGIGIAPDVAARLFQRFEQGEQGTKRHFGGTGLGLAICRELVERMGGRIGVESEPGKGSTFWFELPLRSADAAAADDGRGPSRGADADVPAGNGRGTPVRAPGGLRVLLAEDVPINQVLATKMLENAGHAVTVVGDGAQAVAAVIAGDFDVVLMDVRMPEMDGLEATRRIRGLGGERADIPILGLTAEAVREELGHCIEAGMTDTLTKPFKRDELLQRLQEVAAVRAGAGTATGSSAAA